MRNFSHLVSAKTFAFFLLTTTSLMACAAETGDISQVAASLLESIQQSKTRLALQTEQQLKERRKLAASLQTLEINVTSLRKRTAHLQRLKDEKTLNLDDIKTRLKRWQEQDNYQTYALSEYVSRVKKTPVEDQQNNIGYLLSSVDANIVKQKSRFQAQWKLEKVVDNTGKLNDAHVLKLGPVALAYLPDSKRGGLLELSSDKQLPAAIVLEFDRTSIAHWPSLIATGEGNIIFDVGLTAAIKRAQHQTSLVDHVKSGGPWVLPILGFGLLALACALFKALQLFRVTKLPATLNNKLSALSANQDADNLKNLVQTLDPRHRALIDICMNNQGQIREDRLFNLLISNKTELESGLGFIAMIATIAPLLGLLGTVSGMIETFQLMTIFGSGDAATVSSGISEALITTELGLIVAIPSLLTHALLKRGITRHLNREEDFAAELNLQDFTYLSEQQTLTESRTHALV